MTNMQTYRIKKQEDIARIPTNTPIQLEIYLKGTEISLKEIDGNCLIRATDCSFPNLKEVKGNLSIDAADVFLPQLAIVAGDCNLHEKNIYVVALQKVRGDLTIYNSVALPELNFVGGKLKNKAKVVIPKLTGKSGRAFEIRHYSDIRNLPSDGYFNLIINLDDCTIPHSNIFGYIQILATDVRFPNLKSTQKLSISRKSVNLDILNPIQFDSLHTIQEDCVISGQWVSFSQLQKIGKNLRIDESLVDCSKLQEVGGSINITSSRNLTFPSLESISSNFEIGETNSNFNNYSSNVLTRFLQSTILQSTLPSRFPKLKYIGGNVRLSTNLNFPKLEEVGGKLLWFVNSPTFINLKRIHTLDTFNIRGSKSLKESLPQVGVINNAIYTQQIDSFIEKVDNLFTQIFNDVYVSKNEFFIRSRWNRTNEDPKYPLKILIAILKMRHSSFQNFQVREFDREWNIQHAKANELLEAIQEQWQSVKSYTYKDIFKIEDRNLRRFCFNYIGVSEMMQALDARKIGVDGIELNYFKYDSLGKKTPFKKHNIFEVYEAELSKIEELRGWRNQGQKVYAVKCWCTSTEHEHWLWIESQYKDDPLAAIASTFRIHENVIPHIKCLKRQGDVLICEMKTAVIPEGNVRPLTKTEYFGLLEVET